MTLRPWRTNNISLNSSTAITFHKNDGKQNPYSKTYTLDYEYGGINSMGPVEEQFLEVVGGVDTLNRRDRYQLEATINKSGFYQVRIEADESVDHNVYINKEEFINSLGSVSNFDDNEDIVFWYGYLNENDLFTVRSNHDNDFDYLRVSFRRLSNVQTFTYHGYDVPAPRLIYRQT